MFDPKRLSKLISSLERLIQQLESHQEITIHQHIQQFSYMEQVEELKMLMEQSEAAHKRAALFSRWAQASYLAAYKQWRKDARWLNQYLIKKRFKSIL